MAEDPNVKILNRCHIAPPPGSVSSTSLPLTFFDVLWLSVIPMERLFFYQYPYPTHHFIQTILPTLTHSLSVTLKYFFPFAANLICPPQPRKPHILYVDGDSLALTVAESAAEFNHLISDHPRDVKALHPLTPKLLSARVLEDGSLALPLMAIQVTIFPDSGFSIGVIFNHVAADGRSFHHFMKSWASICRNGGTCLEEPEPFHNRAEIRDPNELELNFLNWWWNYGAPKLKVDSGLTHFSFTDKVRATIVLSRAQIQKLKHWFELAQTHSLSTFVATCSLIWVCMVKSEESVIGISGDDKLCYIIFSADCRNRYELSIPSTYFGNCLAFCYVPLKRKEVVGELGLVEAAKAIGNKVKELERGALKGAERWMQMGKEIVGHHTVIVAASPKFNVYQTDFGWGKLKKSEVVHIDKLGIISLAEGRDEEGGIEVGLALPQAQMNKFSAILRECLELLTILQPQATMAGHNSELNFLKNFRIPNYILVPETKVESNHDAPTCPVLVFINSKSGGQLGGDLLKTYRNLLNEKQVFDLGEEAPDKVLRRIYANLEILKLQGDQFAIGTMEKLKLIVAGGDGTAGWLLGVVCDLKLSHPPPIVTVPLGTGNNLPFAFGWGKKNPGTDQSSVESFLSQVIKAKEMKIDNWHILMRMRAPKEGSCDPIAPLELPHSLHAFHRVSEADELNMEGYHTFHGGFWNYFSMGMDAQVSYAFHSERKMHPEKFKNQLVNQSTYAKLGCTQGWFFAHLTHPPSRNIAHIAKVKIMKRDGEWKDLHIPSCIRSIICLNLPSFSGGLNPWGTPNGKKRNERDLTPPFVDDGLLEVVGFRDAWHGLVLLAPNGHGTRLAQAHRIRFEFHKGAADHTYMRIDGEPWKQPLPVDDDTVVVEISHLGQVNILATHDCRSKSVRDQSTSDHDVEEDDSADEDTTVEDFRKFGAADTFRIPDEVDLSHLS